MTQDQRDEAIAFQTLLLEEGLCTKQDAERRLEEIETSISESDSYTLTTLECTHGARVAWRNSIRCIGRLFWKGMHVFDKRHVQTIEEVFQALEEHSNHTIPTRGSNHGHGTFPNCKSPTTTLCWVYSRGWIHLGRSHECVIHPAMYRARLDTPHPRTTYAL
jgi:hypothetical protein